MFTLALLALALLGPGCAADGAELSEQAEVVDEFEQAIWNGDLTPGSLQERFGLVSISGCSAVAITSRWLLSARHCGDKSGQSVTFLGRSYRVGASFLHPGYPAQQMNDIQAIRLDTPLLRPNGTEWAASVSILPGGLTVQNHIGTSLLCFGAGSGSWRSFPFRGEKLNRDGFLELRSTGGYIQPGDSGGPCFKFEYSGAPGTLVSVTKGGFSSKPRNTATYGGDVNVIRDDLALWVSFTVIGNP